MAGYCGFELEQYLNNPTCQEFIKDVPQAGRLLRPLAQMFQTKIPDVLKRPKNTHAKRVMNQDFPDGCGFPFTGAPNLA
jgi:hypothetical protein